MGRTKLTNRGIGTDRVNDKMRRFAEEYLVDYNGTRAARAAKYAHPEQTAVRLLKDPRIRAMIGKAENQTRERLELTREEVLRQLCYLATRDGKDFIDPETGQLLPIQDLPERASQAIDGIKQKVRITQDSEGNETRHIETELKLVSKGTALDMAMKHHGLFAPQEQKVGVSVDLGGLLGQLMDAINNRRNVIDAKAIEAKADEGTTKNCT